jgi:hypothetical protein
MRAVPIPVVFSSVASNGLFGELLLSSNSAPGIRGT